MTRDEFINGMAMMWELKDFCIDNDCPIMDDVFDSDYLDEYLDREIEDWSQNMSWTTLRDKLNEIETGYDWYCWDGYGDITPMDEDDLDYYKDDILSWGDDHDIWDVEDEELEPDDEFEDELCEPEDDEDEAVEEPFSVFELIVSCQSEVTNAKLQAEKEEKESDDALVQFISVDMAM